MGFVGAPLVRAAIMRECSAWTSGDDPVDIDNIIKPIQDALVGLGYIDDILVIDVESRRRPLAGTYDVGRCTDQLLQGIATGGECVYVRLSD